MNNFGGAVTPYQPCDVLQTPRLKGFGVVFGQVLVEILECFGDLAAGVSFMNCFSVLLFVCVFFGLLFADWFSFGLLN